jgi:phage tail protein X
MATRTTEAIPPEVTSMGGVVRFVRFVIGCTMVAAGVALCVPVVPRVVTLASSVKDPVGIPAATVDEVVPQQPWHPDPSIPTPRWDPEAFTPLSQTTVLEASWPTADPAAGMPSPWSGADAPKTAEGWPPAASGVPSAPPTPMPPWPTEFASAQPPLGPAYRSTLASPPPPLLDVQRPPPAAGRPMASHGMPPPARSVTVPSTYRIRDGDDLPGIAARFYGHPAAASAVWAANRDLIADPGLLPIGAILRLPPPWVVDSARPGSAWGASIEPAPGAVRPAGS